MIDVEHVSFSYDKRKAILDDVSFSIGRGEVFGVLGPNGTGKTTIIKCINRILKPDAGEIRFDGRSIRTMKQRDIAKIMAYVPQYMSSFFNLIVVEAVMMGRLPYAGRCYSAEDERIAFEVIEKMNLEPFAFRSIREMSGGERQRVFIARAMAQQPQVIILDEPTSSLDVHNQLFILNTIAQLSRREGITIIMTIHDLNLASLFCDTVLMLRDGHVFAMGPTQEVLTEENIHGMYRVRTRITVEDGFKHVRLLKE